MTDTRPAVPQKEGNVHLRLSKAIYNFTDTQDLRLAVGYKAKVDEKGALLGVRAADGSLQCTALILCASFTGASLCSCILWSPPQRGALSRI